jgi:hypothetical protein
MQLNDNIDKQNLNHKVSFEAMKSKSAQLESELDHSNLNLDIERNNYKNLQLKVIN